MLFIKGLSSCPNIQNLIIIKQKTIFYSPSTARQTLIIKPILKQSSTPLPKFPKNHKIKTYFPVHPRTKKQLALFDIELNPKYFLQTEPVGYLEMLALQKYSKLIFTDSGGIQEEACILQTPSITLRDNTERPETLGVGASMLTGPNKHKIIAATSIMLAKNKTWKNPFGTGKSGQYIINTLK